MPQVDLTRARASVRERVLIDRCTITRNPRQFRDAKFDEATGEYVLVGGDDLDLQTLATDVPCLVSELSLQEQEGEGAGETVAKRWSVKLDFDDAPDDLQLGDCVRLTTSTDPLLQGKPMYVARVYEKTLRVWRVVETTRRIDASSQY